MKYIGKSETGGNVFAVGKAESPRPNIGDTFISVDGKQYTVRHVGGYDDYAGMWRVKVEGDNNWTFYRPK